MTDKNHFTYLISCAWIMLPYTEQCY